MRIFGTLLFFVFYSLHVLAQPDNSSVLVGDNFQAEEEFIKTLELFSQKKYAEVIPILKRYSEKNPTDKNLKVLLIKAFVYSKDCGEALNIYRGVEISLDVSDKDKILVDIVQCYIQDKRYKDAIDYLNSVRDSSANKEAVKYLLATVSFAMQNYKDAKPLFKELFEKSSVYKYKSAYYLSVICSEEKRLDDAIKYLEFASKDNDSEEGREAARIMNNIAVDRERLKSKGLFKPFFKIKNAYVIDSNVPEMAENEDENLRYITNVGSVSMRWGARLDLELSGGVNFKKNQHKASGTLMYFNNFHFLPVNSMVKRSEFDANFYDIMFLYVGARYSYEIVFDKDRLSFGLEIGTLNLFNDQFGSFVHDEGAKSGPNFYLTSIAIVPNIAYSFRDIMVLKPYYRLRSDNYHRKVEEPAENSMSGFGHSIGLEGMLYFLGEDTLFVKAEYDKNNAEGTQWRYAGYRLGLGLSIIALSVVDLRFLIDYFIRDFSDSRFVLDDGSERSRNDKRLSISVGPEFILGKSGRLGLKYSSVFNKSNITDIYDYQRHLGMLFWEVRF
ncbi:MAG: hypothetical protein N2746_06950 [Deltaproteobacteria bacterium]|nr:hypothetical protein [Deltaproteobacteria bacterium]